MSDRISSTKIVRETVAHHDTILFVNREVVGSIISQNRIGCLIKCSPFIILKVILALCPIAIFFQRLLNNI